MTSTTAYYARWIDAALAGGTGCTLPPHRIEDGVIRGRWPQNATLDELTWAFKTKPELYNEFADLDPKNEEEVLRFIDEWGLPGSRYDPDRAEYAPPVDPPEVSYEKLSAEIRQLRQVREIYIDRIQPPLESYHYWKRKLSSKSPAQRKIEKDRFDAAVHRVMRTVEERVELARRQFAGARPRLRLDESGEYPGIAEEWEPPRPYAPTLLHIMWLQFYRDILDRHSLHRCANCKSTFARQTGRSDVGEAHGEPKFRRKDTKYCSFRCAKTAWARKARKARTMRKGKR